MCGTVTSAAFEAELRIRRPDKASVADVETKDAVPEHEVESEIPIAPPPRLARPQVQARADPEGAPHGRRTEAEGLTGVARLHAGIQESHRAIPRLSTDA
ncbi:uncharacterized protein C8Q71DRAFT_862987 [Rhodofomes roseus]|uniref:Uncharacterized protein n=1 Tax=Rhodofomes roseus TaxID=34475 RepID=A0ABQ8JZU3_9APHY|nr:uncharacterized protein C8Q71DRAFT_862987 [Rhodofomes roseus]KAH9829898.1 hypothetical protein C8Q71DRAFT_862987 [Rhodofomes roseus]